MKTLGVAPSRTVVIEDTPTGTRAGVAAGATVFGLTTLNTPPPCWPPGPPSRSRT
jgi:beta-phosphoglucomutase-like phosphatase (HAD superfamily)